MTTPPTTTPGVIGKVEATWASLDDLDDVMGELRRLVHNVEAAHNDKQRWIVKDNGVWARQAAARMLEAAAGVYRDTVELSEAAQEYGVHG